MRLHRHFAALCALVSLALSAQQPADPGARTRELVEQLRSSDPSVRGAAKFELIRSANADALPLLLKEIPRSSDPALAAMLEVLAVYKDPRKIPVLLAVAPQANVESQLVELGAPAAQAMMQSLKENCDPYDTGIYTGWVGNTMADMPKISLPLFVAAIRDGNSCQQSAAEGGLQRAYAQPEYGLNDPTINLFIEAVESDDAVIRAAAGKWIDSYGGNLEEKLDFEGTVDLLIRTYRANAPPATMVAIAQMLAAAPRPRVTRFMNAARHAPNPEIRRIAEQYSANEQSPASSQSESSEVDPLAAPSLHDPDPATRIKAAEALGQSDGALKTTPILVQALHDRDAKVRVAVVAALGELNGYSNDPRNERERDVSCAVQLAETLRNDMDPAVRAAAAQSLGDVRDFNENVARALRAALKDSDEGVITQAMATLAARQDTGSAPTLADIYHAPHHDTQLKIGALVALVNICDPSSEPVFLEALGDGTTAAAEQASWGLLCTLKKEPNPNAVEPLLKLLSSHPTSDIIQAAGATKDPRVLEPLLLILTSPDTKTRAWGADALNYLGDKRAIPALAILLKDSKAEVRISAAFALSNMSDYPAPKELLQAALDENSIVQVWAAKALVSSRDPKAADALLAAADFNFSAIDALSLSKNPGVVAPLIAVLQDKARKSRVRVSAAQALGILGDNRAVAALIGVLNESDEELLKTAARALGELHDATAVEPLKALLLRLESLPSAGRVDVDVTVHQALRQLRIEIPQQTTAAPH